MPDYIYLLENRLSVDQQNALRQLREAAREAGMILFLTGDAVRDLTSGHAVRDLEVAVHGNALKLKKTVEKLGANIWGESEISHTLYLCFPGTVRVDVVSTHRVDYAKLEKPVYHAASIQEDLRRRDFTVNAMAISLNDGSYGLLMDPLNGAADIEARTLRLVSNYGFIEDPSLLIRATRYIARLGWEMDAKTRTRYENAKGDGAIEQLSGEGRSRELEQIGHEDDGLKVLRALEEEGWMKALFPAWTAAKADEDRLKALHDLAVELLLQGVHPDMSAAQMQLLTAKLASRDLAALKKLLLRPGFVDEWNSLDSMASSFAKVLLAKENSTASAAFKLFTRYDPEAVLWLGFTSKDKAVQERYHQFLKVWPEARQRIPHALMQEMRITPELAVYKEIVQGVFLELIDGRLTTPEETRAFLEPHSPPAPPPQVTVKRPRAKRGEAKLKERTYDDEESEDAVDDVDDLDDVGGDEDEVDLGLSIPKLDLEPEIGEDLEAEIGDDDLDADDSEPEPEAEPIPVKRGGKSSAAPGKANTHSAVGKDKPATSKNPAEARSSTKVQSSRTEAKTVPAAVPAKASAPPVGKMATAANIRKEDKMAKSTNESPTGANAPGVKPPQVEAHELTPGIKPPQGSEAEPTPVTTLAPGVKPPQVASAEALPAAPAVVRRAPGVKPPQAVKAQVAKAKPAAKKAKATPVAKKPKASAKAAPPKKKAKVVAKHAAKPVKKAVKPVKSKKAAGKSGKKR
ncbi:MAG: CCA tRNA nucleotidyltransferase [Terracidiphilus sp.]